MSPETTSQNAVPNQQTSSTFKQSLRNSCSKLERCVEKDPKTTILASLGAGLGIGVAVGVALSGSKASSRHTWLDRRTAEAIGHKMLKNLGSWVPDSVSNRFPN